MIAGRRERHVQQSVDVGLTVFQKVQIWARIQALHDLGGKLGGNPFDDGGEEVGHGGFVGLRIVLNDRERGFGEAEQRILERGRILGDFRTSINGEENAALFNETLGVGGVVLGLREEGHNGGLRGCLRLGLHGAMLSPLPGRELKEASVL